MLQCPMHSAVRAKGSRQPPHQRQRGHRHDDREQHQHATQHFRRVRLPWTDTEVRTHTQVLAKVQISSIHGANSSAHEVTAQSAFS
jgi:hypothetical protein